MRLPTLEDCQVRDVHHYQSGLYGIQPYCKHNVQYKKCKNCQKVVWLICPRCVVENKQQPKVKGKGPEPFTGKPVRLKRKK